MESKLKSPIRRLFELPDIAPIGLVLAFGLIVSLPHINSQLLAGNDFAFHALRYMGTYRALLDGQIIPQMDSASMGGFGYAPNLFYPPLTAYLAVLLNFISPNWNLTINLANILTLLAAGLAMYIFVRKVAGNQTAAVISAIAYLSAPYFLVNTMLRSAAAETMGMVFGPLLFLGVWKIIHRERGWLILGASAAGLLLSHHLSAIIFAAFALIFMLCYLKQLMNLGALRQLLLALTMALGLSAFFLLPLFEARAAAEYNAFVPGFMLGVWAGGTANLVQAHTHQSLASLLLPNDRPPYGWIGFLLPLVLIAVPVVSRRLSRSQRTFTLISLAFALVAFSATLQLFPWAQLPDEALMIQFPWRFNIVITLFIAAIAGIIATATWAHSPFSRRWPREAAPVSGSRESSSPVSAGRQGLNLRLIGIVSAIALVTAGIAIANFSLGREDAYATADFLLPRVWNADYLPTRLINYVDDEEAAAFGASGINRGHDPLALTGQMVFDNFQHYGRRLQFEASVTEGGIVELPVFFYPGYLASVNGVRVPVFESTNGFAAIILPDPSANSSAGQGEVSCTPNCSVNAYFGMSRATQIGAVITGLTLLSLAGYWFVCRSRTRLRTNQVGLA